jgi:serine/threonine protein kinase
MASIPEESSLWNLTLRPTATYSSSAVPPATGIKSGSDGQPTLLHQQFRRYGNFASISSVHNDPTYEHTDLLDFVCFLENRKINVTRSEGVKKSDDISSVLHGNSVEVLQGTYRDLGYNDHLYPMGLKDIQQSKLLVDDDWEEANKPEIDRLLKVLKGTHHDQPVALKYLRRSRLPDPSWKATNSGEYYRLLEIQKNRQRDFLFECKIMAHNFLSQHRNIVKLLAVFFEDDEVLPNENNIFAPVMVVELADERFPDLDAYFSSISHPRPITFQDAASFISDIADGLSALHSYGIIHADVKPGNILLFPDASTDNLIAKISDFGFSAIITSNDHARGGTTYWNAPETLERSYISQENINPSHSSRDIYSFGLVSMFIALDGQWPLVPKEASKAKLKDEVFGCIAAKLRKDNAALCRNTDQEALFIWLAKGTLRLKADERWGSLAGVRVALTGKCVLLCPTKATR